MGEPYRAAVRQFFNLDELSHVAAGEFCRIGRDAVAARGRCTVVLSGGSTPRRLYELLALEHSTQLDWKHVECFWGDERAVPPDHKASNFGMARGALLEPLAIPRDHIHRIEGERADLDAASRDYERDIARVLGVPRDGPPPAFDVVLLGVGADGHTASLFPGSCAIDEVERWVVMQHAPSPGPDRVTMTPTILNAARHVLFLVAGGDKAETLARVLEGPQDPRRLPAQAIQPASGTLTWFVDRTAAAHLKQRSEEGRHLVQRTDT